VFRLRGSEEGFDVPLFAAPFLLSPGVEAFVPALCPLLGRFRILKAKNFSDFWSLHVAVFEFLIMQLCWEVSRFEIFYSSSFPLGGAFRKVKSFAMALLLFLFIFSTVCLFSSQGLLPPLL